MENYTQGNRITNNRVIGDNGCSLGLGEWVK